MKFKLLVVLTSALTVLGSGTANATITLFDADSPAWTTAISGLSATTAYDFTLDADYGINGFDGPLTTAGGGPVSAGVVSAGVVLDSMQGGPGGPPGGAGGNGLVGLGPSAGFGNTKNAVAPNLFVDALEIVLAGPVRAFETVTLSLFGGDNLIDVYTDTVLRGSLALSPDQANFNLGILSDGTMDFTRIWIHSPSGGGEGVSGLGRSFTAIAAPEPGVAALFGIGLLVGGVMRRRRR